jgi:predicted TIM-barrel fold metal-dependent hydrolase
VIDWHCHAGTGDGMTGPWDTCAPLASYRRRAAAAGIDATVLFAPFSSDYASANAQVARIVAGEPDRFVGFAFVHPERDRGQIARLVGHAVRRYGFRGIKAHRHDGRLTREVCEVADRWRLPLLYDVMGDVAPLELFASEYPRVAFVVPHLGSFADDWRAQRAFLDILARHPNMHTDTSGVRRFDLLVEAVRRAGPRRVLYGSDGPWLHPGLELAKVQALGLPHAAQRLVTGGNAVRLLSRVRTGVPLPRHPATGELPPAADPWERR